MSTLAIAAGVWFGVHWVYVASMHAKAVHKRGAMSKYWLVMLLPLVVVGLVLDVVFNAIFGTLMYRELPREWLFTHRCRRHLASKGSRGRMARWWQRQLNAFDPGHV